jgi:hypothetical protein
MKHALAFVCAFASLWLCATAQDRPTSLFNGKDLSGWTPVHDKDGADPSRTWSVVDGVLRCTGKPIGYLKTDREYGDYTLTVEWRWPAGTEGGNNGVLVHATTPRALGIWPKSIEVQLFKGNAGEFWVIGTELDVADEATRKQDRRHKNLVYGSEKPVGEWNRMEIVCKGDTVKVKVNDTLVNEATNCSVTRGAICLQSEGTPIEFRNIFLTPLKK